MNKVLNNNWQTKKLGEVCEVVTGTTPPKSDMTNYGNEIPFFKPPHLWDNLIHTTEEKLSLNGAKKARVVPPNTVLVTCIGNLGRTGFVKKEAAFNQQINAILENEKLIGKYLFYQAQSPSFRNQLERLATGTTVSIVNKKNFETIEIPVPPLETQHAIVSKIEELFSELDQGIADLKTAQAQLKVYRQSVLKHAFEGKLTNKNVKEGELPEGWRVNSFGEVVINFDGKRKPLSRTVRATRQGTYRYYGATEIVDYIDDFIFEGRYLLIGEDGANLLSKSRPLAFIVEGKFWVNNHAHIVQTKDILNLDFLSYYFNSLNIAEYVTGTAQPKLNQANMNKIPIPLPSINEQHLIVQEIESRLSVADKMEESIQESLQKAEALRQSILKKAFSGELV